MKTCPPRLRAVSLTCACLAATLLFLSCRDSEERHESMDTAALLAANPCVYRDGGSQWVSRDDNYQAVAEYGRKPGEEIADLWGLTTTRSGEILLYDAGSRHVKHLRQDLALAGTYGRDGTGPGEFSYQRVIHGNWIAAADSTFLVLTPRGLVVFTVGVGFTRNHTVGHPFAFDVMDIVWTVPDVLYAVDRIDREGGARTLETWRVDSSGTESLVRADPMPALPHWNGRFVWGDFVSQAEPLWAARADCGFVSDGSSDWLLRVDLRERRADTLHMPPRNVPQRTPADEERLEQLRRAGARAGMVTGTRQVVPTARMKWTNMIMDPDGYVWLEPWRPFSSEALPGTAIVVDPATGTVDSMTVPAFPDAFLPGGEFITRQVDPTAGVIFIRKYALRHPQDSSGR